MSFTKKTYIAFTSAWLHSLTSMKQSVAELNIMGKCYFWTWPQLFVTRWAFCTLLSIWIEWMFDDNSPNVHTCLPSTPPFQWHYQKLIFPYIPNHADTVRAVNLIHILMLTPQLELSNTCLSTSLDSAITICYEASANVRVWELSSPGCHLWGLINYAHGTML